MNLNFSLAQKAVRILALLLLVSAAPAGRAQASSNNGGPADSTQGGIRFSDKVVTVDHQDGTADMHRMHQLNVARQKSMVSDAEKLLALARTLNAGVGPDGSALSPAQKMRMVADIEKLAHSVKDKMSYMAGTPQVNPMLQPSATWPQ